MTMIQNPKPCGVCGHDILWHAHDGGPCRWQALDSVEPCGCIVFIDWPLFPPAPTTPPSGSGAGERDGDTE